MFGNRELAEMRRQEREADAAMITEAIKAALNGVQPENGILVVNHMQIVVNQCNGGGAEIHLVIDGKEIRKQ